MNLTDALNIQRGDVVTFVGAGGKTTAMYRLADELAQRDWRVLVTTTTKIWPPEPGQVGGQFFAPNAATARKRLVDMMTPGRRLLMTAELEAAENKLRGVSAELVCQVATADLVDVVLVEADGANGRSLKAPERYEPVVPPCTTLLVPVAGLDAVGQPLSEAIVHRIGRVSALTGLQPGEIITPAHVARVLTHPNGGLKDAPPAARVAVLLNKVDERGRMRPGREVAHLILELGGVDRVLLAAVGTEDAVRDVHTVRDVLTSEEEAS
ncbi:MAG: putative selenium-dependent hydroxylase accessory protein YqeC [Chloroflexi bacterium]|nr:putative selenium-dependent hydroxylase accessory protein YqeC [Chloroflexota bacterium]MBU1750791.1 putative selenium-dependent hydroxylase accessory protein YqeC [Chloroflexota bacterium]